MTTNNAIDIATGAVGTILAGAGVGVPPTFSATPSGLTSIGTPQVAWNSSFATYGVSVSVSSAQILNMVYSASPVTLIAAPGAGKAIIVTGYMIRYVAGTTAYSGAQSSLFAVCTPGFGGINGNYNLIWGTAGMQVDPTGSDGLSQNANNWVWLSTVTNNPSGEGFGYRVPSSAVTNFYLLENQPVVLTQYMTITAPAQFTSGTNYTAGNGTLQVDITYRIHNGIS